MKKKGFTLVELMGVIVLLGILGVVIIPKIGNSITNGKEISYKAQIEQIKKATRDFFAENTDLLDDDSTVTIKLGVLKQKGYLPVDMKNPKNKKTISNESTIAVTEDDGNYNIEVTLVDLESVTENTNSNAPIIVLNGNYIEYVDVDSFYNDKGAIARTAGGREIYDVSVQIEYNGVEQTKLDTSQTRTYNVIYSATDSGVTSTATRTVIVRDTEPPKIIFPKDTIIPLNQVFSFDASADVRVIDNHDSNPTLTVNSSIADLPGTYIMTYIARDHSGNETTERRIVKVIDFSSYYTQLEYIESTGAQYILTDIVPTDDTGVVMRFSSSNTNTNGIFIGSKSSTNVNFGIGNIDNEIYFGWNTLTPSEDRREIIENTIYEAELNYEGCNASGLNSVPVDAPLGTLESTTAPIAIFANNNNGTINAYSRIKLYQMVITENDEMTHYLIPCKRNVDDEIGLYDAVTGNFYTNMGSENFRKGEL